MNGKILVLWTGTFPRHFRLENEMNSLHESGYETHLACFKENCQSATEKFGNITIHRKSISKFLYKTSVGALKFPFYFNFWRRFVKELYKKEHFDYIHIVDLPLAQIGIEVRERYGSKLILDLHENWPEYLKNAPYTHTFIGRIISSHEQWKKYEFEMCSKTDCIIVVVDEAKERLVQAGIPPQKLFVVSNTLNLNSFSVSERKDFNKGFTNLLYVGSISHGRGLQYVIDAIGILKKRNIDIRFNLVGDGKYLANLKEQIDSLGVTDKVIIHGYKNYNEIAELYQTSDIAIIPHLKTGHTDSTIPHKIFQYMFAQIPQIVSNCVPLVRIINETKSGVSYTFDNPFELADIIENFNRHPEQLYDYIKTGRKAVIDKYNWSTDAKVLVSLYNSL